MQLPTLEHPERYQSLFVVDFGQSFAVGYTADEVAMLLESERFAAAKVYRIHNARPDGTLEMIGVPRDGFLLEAGVFFYSRDEAAGQRDYARLAQAAADSPLPCRARLILGRLPSDSRWAFVVGLAYPAEQDQDVSAWLLEHELAAGEYADGGVSRWQGVRERAQIVESSQLLPAQSRRSRTREEVFAAVGQAIQRVA